MSSFARPGSLLIAQILQWIRVRYRTNLVIASDSKAAGHPAPASLKCISSNAQWDWNWVSLSAQNSITLRLSEESLGIENVTEYLVTLMFTNIMSLTLRVWLRLFSFIIGLVLLTGASYEGHLKTAAGSRNFFRFDPEGLLHIERELLQAETAVIDNSTIIY